MKSPGGARNQNTRLAELLLLHGARVDTTDRELRTALHYAALAGDTAGELVQAMLKYHAATVSKFVVVIVYCLPRYKPDTMARDMQGDTALHCLARSGDARAARGLLQLDTERGRGLVSLANTAGQTAAHVAASRGHAEFLAVLRDFNDDFSTQDNEGQTPLHLCVTAELTGAVLLKCNVMFLQKTIFFRQFRMSEVFTEIMQGCEQEE